MDIRSYNRAAWDRQVEKGNRWTVPVGPEVIAAARRGEWQVVLTPARPVPRAWFPPLRGLDVLCLACGGGRHAFLRSILLTTPVAIMTGAALFRAATRAPDFHHLGRGRCFRRSGGFRCHSGIGDDSIGRDGRGDTIFGRLLILLRLLRRW